MSGVAVVVTLSISSACGGGGHGLEKHALIKRADGICAATNAKVGPLFAQLFPNGDETPPAAVAAPVMARIGSDLVASYDDLRRLEPRDDDAPAYGEVLDRFHVAVSAMATSARLAKAGDTVGYLREVQAGNAAFQRVAAPARKFGFSTCGQP